MYGDDQRQENANRGDQPAGLSLSEYPYTVTEGQWECCPGSWSDGESVGGGGGPFRFRQMGGGRCLTMLEPTC